MSKGIELRLWGASKKGCSMASGDLDGSQIFEEFSSWKKRQCLIEVVCGSNVVGETI